MVCHGNSSDSVGGGVCGPGPTDPQLRHGSHAGAAVVPSSQHHPGDTINVACHDNIPVIHWLVFGQGMKELAST